MPALDPLSAFAAAVETRLRGWFPANRWAFEIVPDPITLEEFRRVLAVTPLLAFSWQSLKPAKDAGRAFQGELRFRITLVVKNPNARSARFLGDSKGPGLFPAVATVVAALHGWTAPELGTLFATDVNQSYADGWDDVSGAIATIDLAATIKFGDVLGAAAGADDFLRLLAAWDVGALDGEPSDTITPRAA